MMGGINKLAAHGPGFQTGMAKPYSAGIFSLTLPLADRHSLARREQKSATFLRDPHWFKLKTNLVGLRQLGPIEKLPLDPAPSTIATFGAGCGFAKT